MPEVTKLGFALQTYNQEKEKQAFLLRADKLIRKAVQVPFKGTENMRLFIPKSMHRTSKQLDDRELAGRVLAHSLGHEASEKALRKIPKEHFTQQGENLWTWVARKAAKGFSKNVIPIAVQHPDAYVGSLPGAVLGGGIPGTGLASMAALAKGKKYLGLDPLAASGYPLRIRPKMQKKVVTKMDQVPAYERRL